MKTEVNRTREVGEEREYKRKLEGRDGGQEEMVHLKEG